jgi:hypothetical protein
MSTIPLTPPPDDDKKLAYEHVEDNQIRRRVLHEAPEAHLVEGHGPVDRAAEILAAAGKIDISDEDDRRVLRKIDFWVLSECREPRLAFQ